MRAKKFWALLLSAVILLGTMPFMEIHVHAEEYTWNPNATMTLKCGDEVVEPKEVIETADTKMKVYQISSVSDYTLTTSADNDYAVMFEVDWSVISEDEYGYKDYDYEMTVTLDNVTIRTYNPRVDENEKIHAAMTFSDEKSEQRYETLHVELVGNNTVELLGVKDDSKNDRWSAISFVGPNTMIEGEGTLNATSRYSNAVGAVSALYTENSVGLYETVTLNATADVEAKEADVLIGDGLYFDDYDFIMEAGTTTNIKASGSGIMHGTEHVRAEWLNNMHINGDLDIRAADYGISWQSGGINMGDGVDLIIKGLSDASAPEVGILVRRGIVVGAGCTLEVDALGSAISCRAVTTANPSSPLIVGINSVVELSGSVDSNVFVLDCGTKLSGTNNVMSGNGEEWFGERYPVSELMLEEGAKLTINAGYLALRAATMELKNGSELDIRTEKYPESENVEESMAVYISTSRSYVRNGAKLNIEVASDYAIYGFTSLYLESNNVYLKSADRALYSGLGIYRGTDPVIYTFESDDGINWIPFANKNTKPYFTTKEPATHICAASRTANTYSDKVWTPIESEDKHTAKCIYCAADIVADCQWDRGAWYYSSGVYTLKFECEVCERERFSDVEYHSHVFNTWTPLMGDYYPMHESTCTVEGCGASTEDYCSNSYGAEYHIGPTTMRKDCTRCGQFTTWEFDSSSVEVIYMEAKSASCDEVGNIEFWSCKHCNKYYADEACTKVLDPSEAFIQPAGHSYGADGACTVCGDKIKTLDFVPNDGYPNEYEYYYVILGKASNGKLYVMGNESTADGRRKAVEIPADMISADGTIKLTSEMAEFIYRESVGTSNVSLMADGGCFTFSAEDGIFVYNPAFYGDEGLPYGGNYSPNYSSDEIGNGGLYAYYPNKYSERVWLRFNEEDLCFDVSDTEIKNIYIYIQLCEHSGLYYNEPVDPTCTEQGTRAYYGCGKCGTYYSDASATTPYEFPDYVDPFDHSAISEYFNIPALRHSFNSEGVCENCGMKRNVYKPVTSLEQFDQLSEEAYYIIVFKDGDKTYAAFLPDINHVNDPLFADINGNGIVDMMEPDANSNGIPDCIETYIDTYWGSVDYNEDGICSVDEYNEAIGSMDDDEDVDADDYKLFFEMRMYWDLYYEYENKTYNVPNIVEVTVAPDGSITIIDEGAMEFQMMPSGIWGGQEYDGSELEYEGIKETERLRAAWVPNWWIANYGTMGEYGEEHFLTQNRWFGDRNAPGVIDNKNWKISFNEDGTALLVSTWAGFDDSAALQLVKYTDADGNERITMVGCYDELWQYSDILSNCTVISGAYLYASEPAYDHTHEWGPWTDDEVADTHTRKCTVEGCDKKQTENHNWDDGVQIGTPTCTEGAKIVYTCGDCGATYEEDVDCLGHDFGEWDFYDENTHRMTCSVCNYYTEEEHDWDDGVETVSPTCYSTGVMTYTCGTCDHVKTEEIPALEHTFTDWYPDGDENHKRDCMDDRCDKFETLPHKWDDGEITKEPTCKEAGVKIYTCKTCMHTKTEDLPILDHEFGEWTPNNDGKTHSRFCSCGEAENEDHNFDDVEVTKAPTHEAVGEKKYTCSDCRYSYTEEIPVLTEHEWSEWVINKLDEANTHIRFCFCGESQDAPHNFDDGVVTTEATHTSKGVKTFTCDDCGYSYTEEIPETTDHEWTDWSPNGDGTHTRACRCNANETKDCTYDDGVVTEKPTHIEPGTKLFTCTICGHTYEEDIPVLTDHEWGDWKIGETVDMHTRFCKCGEFESKAHEFGDEEIELQPTDNSIHIKSVCSVCGYEKDTVAQGAVVTFTNCEGLDENPLIFIKNGDSFTLKLPTADDVDEREGYRLIGWTASIDGINYSAGAELFIEYTDITSITFSAEWAKVVGVGEQQLSENEAYITDMDAFEIEGEGITYQGEQVFYVSKEGLYALIEAKNDEEVE